MSASKRSLLPLSQARLPLYAGIDLGGTNIKAALVDTDGRIVAFHTEPTHATRGPEDTAARMGRMVQTLAGMVGIAASDIAGVGLGTPGPQDLKTGVILRAGNLPGWDSFPIRDRVAAHCGHAVTYANDATAGVGGGIIIGNNSIDGAHSHASEFGHIIVDTADTARTCPFGHSGDLEAYCSATALTARARDAIAIRTESSLSKAVAGGEALTPILISREAAAGDPLANELILETARWLGIGIVTLMHTLDPEAVLIGGAMTFGGEGAVVGRAFIERIRAEVRARAFPLLAEKTVIRYASLGGDAGSIGAAGFARRARTSTAH
jgi:glucokinase